MNIYTLQHSEYKTAIDAYTSYTKAVKALKEYHNAELNEVIAKKALEFWFDANNKLVVLKRVKVN